MATNKAKPELKPREPGKGIDDLYPENAPPPPPPPTGDGERLPHSFVMGGSTAAQRINCPGSYELESQMPKAPESDYATQGSVFHAAMELILTADPETDDDLDTVIDELEGKDLGFGEGWEITREQINMKIRPAWAAWEHIRDTYKIDDWFIEQRVSLDTVIPQAFGTVDLLCKDEEKYLHVLDWKFGDGVIVPVEGNAQLTFYAACSLYDPDPEVKEFCDDIAGIYLHVIQPRVGAERHYDSWETDETFIEKFLDQAAAAADAAVKPDAPIKPGSHCRWCSAKPICPAHEQAAVDALSKQPDSMTATELADALNKAVLLKAWIADVFALAQRELEQGASVPGFKLVQKQPRRQWIDPAEAEKALRKAKVKVGEMFKRTLLSPTQIEKAVPNVYAQISESMVHSVSSGVTVVPDSDKREAVADQFALLANAMTETGNSN